MQHTTEGEVSFPEQEGPRPPGLGICQRKPSDNQGRETENYAPMRDSEVAIHPNHLLAGLVPRPRTDELREKVYEVVQDHETKRQRDQDPVSPTNPLDNRVRRAARGLHVYRTNGEAL